MVLITHLLCGDAEASCELVDIGETDASPFCRAMVGLPLRSLGEIHLTEHAMETPRAEVGQRPFTTFRHRPLFLMKNCLDKVCWFVLYIDSFCILVTLTG